MTEGQIKHMAERFLQWRLPADFSPDAGISFKADYNENTPWPGKHEPVGTNLFNFNQAQEMVRHMVEGLPKSEDSNAARLSEPHSGNENAS